MSKGRLSVQELRDVAEMITALSAQGMPLPGIVVFLLECAAAAHRGTNHQLAANGLPVPDFTGQAEHFQRIAAAAFERVGPVVHYEDASPGRAVPS